MQCHIYVCMCVWVYESMCVCVCHTRCLRMCVSRHEIAWHFVYFPVITAPWMLWYSDSSSQSYISISLCIWIFKYICVYVYAYVQDLDLQQTTLSAAKRLAESSRDMFSAGQAFVSSRIHTRVATRTHTLAHTDTHTLDDILRRIKEHQQQIQSVGLWHPHRHCHHHRRLHHHLHPHRHLHPLLHLHHHRHETISIVVINPHPRLITSAECRFYNSFRESSRAINCRMASIAFGPIAITITIVSISIVFNSIVNQRMDKLLAEERMYESEIHHLEAEVLRPGSF